MLKLLKRHDMNNSNGLRFLIKGAGSWSLELRTISLIGAELQLAISVKWMKQGKVANNYKHATKQWAMNNDLHLQFDFVHLKYMVKCWSRPWQSLLCRRSTGHSVCVDIDIYTMSKSV